MTKSIAATNVSHLQPDPFGMITVGRSWSTTDESYRYKFQGQESDDEMYGDNNEYAFEYRIYNPRLGKFLSIDPLTKDYVYNSPYAFSENKVIQFVELEGLETGLPPLSVGAYIQSLWHSAGIYNNGDLQHVTQTVARKDAKNYVRTMALLVCWEDFVLLSIDYAIDAALLKTASTETKVILAETKALSVETKVTEKTMTVTSEMSVYEKRYVRENYAKTKFGMPEDHCEYVDFDKPVSSATKGSNDIMYQYRRKLSNGIENTTMGEYFVSDPSVTPEMVGLRSEDYELYEITLSEETNFFTETHKTNSSVYYDKAGKTVEGGGNLLYKKGGASGTAKKIIN